MQHFLITMSFLKREGDIHTSIMQDIMRAYLLFKIAPQAKVGTFKFRVTHSRTAMTNVVGMNTVKRLIAQVQGCFAHVDRNCASCFGHPKYDKINLF